MNKISPLRRPPVSAEMTPFLTVPDVAERLQVCERTVRRWIVAGKLKAHHPGGVVRISVADLNRFLERNR